MKHTKNILVTIIGICLYGAGLYFMKSIEIPIGIMKTLPYILVGIGCGAFGYGIGEVLSKAAADKNPDLAKKMNIQMMDERNIMIEHMSKAKGYDMMTFVFAGLLLAYALMNVSFVIIIPFAIAYLFIHLYSVTFRIKSSKKY